jgi:hypothetical protein
MENIRTGQECIVYADDEDDLGEKIARGEFEERNVHHSSNLERSADSPGDSHRSGSGDYDLSSNSYSSSDSYGSGPGPFDSIIHVVLCIFVALGRLVLAVVVAAITQAICLIIVAFGLGAITGNAHHSGLMAILFVVGWWGPPAVLFILISGLGQLIVFCFTKKWLTLG